MDFGNSFWKWAVQEDNIFYTIKNIVKTLDQPEVAGTRGQFSFKNFNSFIQYYEEKVIFGKLCFIRFLVV